MAVMTVVGFLVRLWNLQQIIFPLVLLRMALANTKHPKSRKCCFVIFFELENIFHIAHASLRAHRSCFKISSSDLSSSFGVTTTLMRTSVLNHTFRWTLSFPNFLVAWCTFENCTLRFVPKDVVSFLKIELDSPARCPGMRNLIAWNSSTRQQKMYHHSFSVFCQADCQPLCA